jgi:hypothetical protein
MALPIPPGAVPPVAPHVTAVPGAAAAGPPVAAVPGGALPRTEPRTYRELYSDDSYNPAPERIAGYLAGYRFTDLGGGGVPTPAALRDQTIALSDRQSMAFLALTVGQDNAHEVVVVHRLLRYMDAPGDDPSGLHDRVLGLQGDILPHQYPVVEVPGTAFHLVGTAVRVPTIDAMTALIPTWMDADPVLGPYVETDPETEVVRPRYLQLVPGRYAALLVHRRRVRAKQAYQELFGAMQANHDVASCHDVLIWLRAACTARGGGGAQNTVPSVVHGFTPMHLPPEAYSYVTAKVQADLPALATIRRDATPMADTIAGALRTLGATRGGESSERSREPKTIMDAYKETHTTLLRFCNTSTVGAVAPMWTRLANSHKSEQHTVLTQEFHKVCMARGLSTELYAPVITATLKQMVTGLQFVGHGSEDLTSGCQPFLVAYAGSAHHYQALAAASVSNQLAQGEQSASLSDYRTIRESERVKFPRDVSEVAITLTRFAVLCQCLFQGPAAPHPFVDLMWQLAVTIQNIAPFITERFHSVSHNPAVAATYYTRIVRAVQVHVQEYLQAVATNIAGTGAVVELPSFASLTQDLKRGTFHNSTNWFAIPAAYMDPVSVRSVVSTTPAGTATTVTTVSGRTGLSSITTDTNPSAPSVSRVQNPARDAEFDAITLRPGGVRQVIREHRPPSNDAGDEFCVAWWTRGGCFPTCTRRASHQPFASTAERSRLLTYARTYL